MTRMDATAFRRKFDRIAANIGKYFQDSLMVELGKHRALFHVHRDRNTLRGGGRLKRLEALATNPVASCFAGATLSRPASMLATSTKSGASELRAHRRLRF
jgi:hypothetical protein